MKKRNALFASVLALTMLAGCKDATAKLNDSSTSLIKIGSKTITKGDLYELMNSAYGATTVINDANKTIADLEIEVTDEMKETAESTLETYVSMYGDSFTSYLEQVGMTEEDYVNETLIPSLQAEQLVNKYIEDQWDTLVSTYKPVKATLISFTSEDDANAALEEVNGGTDAETAAGSHNGTYTESKVYTTESTSLDSMVRTILFAATEDDGWAHVPGSDGSTYYLVKVDNSDPSSFKDEAVEALSTISDVSDDSTTYFFKKYNFHIYDKTIYDAVAADYPDNLVQDMDDADTAVEADTASTAAAE